MVCDLRSTPNGDSFVDIQPEHRLSRFNIGELGGQQVHIALGQNEPNSARHPCFKVGSLADLQTLQQRIYDHHVRGGASAPKAVDPPGQENSGIFMHTPH